MTSLISILITVASSLMVLLASAAPLNTTTDPHIGSYNHILRTPIKSYIQNNCNFPIYAVQSIKQSCDKKHPNTAVVKIEAHGKSWQKKLSYADDCGISVKLSRNRQMKNVYQVEYVIAPGNGNRISYDLSHVNGNPFTAVKRYLAVTGTRSACKPLYCAAGDDGRGCDWRKDSTDEYVRTCDVAEDVRFYLC